MGKLAFDLIPRKCKECGKSFEGGLDWAFKLGYDKKKAIWFCSWKCIQKYRSEHEIKRRKKAWEK